MNAQWSNLEKRCPQCEYSVKLSVSYYHVCAYWERTGMTRMSRHPEAGVNINNPCKEFERKRRKPKDGEEA